MKTMLERIRSSIFPPDSGLESVRDWRDHVLTVLLGSVVALGTLVAVPSIVLLLLQGLWPVALTDVVLLGLGFLLWRKRTLGLELRAWGLCALLYVLGLALLFVVGPTSQLYLMMSPVFAAIFLRMGAAAFLMLLNAVTLFSVGYWMHVDFHLPGFETQPAMQWLVITLNFVFVNGVIAISIALLLRGLERSFARTQAATRAKSEFLANMSHEIRTPMNAILGLLKLTHGTQLTSQQFDYIHKSEGAAKTLLALINDILDFSKIEADKLEIEAHAFSLNKLMESLAVVLSGNSKSSTVEILFDMDEDLPATVLGDSMRLQQVLTNLGGNAVKFTTHGQVVVSIKRVKAPVGASDTERIEFAVSDTGIGIAPEHRQRIFEGFTQAEGSTTRNFGGTGLGLVISKRLVEAMGGTLDLHSEPGQGSRFFFTLKLPAVGKAFAEQTPSAGPDLQKRRVLIVDDNLVAAKLMQRMAGSWSSTCEVAHSAEQALEWVECARAGGVFPYDLIFMDCTMRGMDGWEASGQLRQACQDMGGAKPLIIMVTASGRDTLEQRTPEEQARIDGLVLKPFSPAMLQAAVLDASAAIPRIRQVSRTGSNQRGLSGMRILVVEDNLVNQQVAEELLVGQGAFVALAANGQLGVDAVQTSRPPFDVVLMDVQMPVMDGYTATQTIRNKLGLKDLPIVGLTANALASDRVACLQSGMNEHVGKPFDLPQLVSLLIRVTGHTPPEKNGALSQSTAQAAPEVSLLTEDINLAPALKRLGGMTALYVRSAKDFCKSLGDLAPQLQALLQAGEAKSLGALAHTFKGTSATLGLERLSVALGQLEKMCVPDVSAEVLQGSLDALAPKIELARAALEQAIALLEPPARVVQKTEAPAPAATEAARHLIQQLRPLLKSDDLTALELMADQRAVLAYLPENMVTRLENALQDLDLQEALQACEAIEDLMKPTESRADVA
jgi:signal transduction histidine kinase/DNA-binding response OmpR family regulator/HPt (histidine-containing phosphotransfer) domain-containing protein